MSEIKLYNDDCMNVLPTIDTDSVDLVLTDIPYGMNVAKGNGLREIDKGIADVVTFDLKKLMQELVRVCKGSLYVFCGGGQMSDIFSTFQEEGLSTRICVWEKTNPSPMNGQHLWLSGMEFCIFGRKSNATFKEHCKNGIWRYPSGTSKLHPTQKPQQLFDYLLDVSSNKGDLVLDCCMGSGTTGISCKKMDRNFIGIELNKEFFDLSSKRINNTATEFSLFDM